MIFIFPFFENSGIALYIQDRLLFILSPEFEACPVPNTRFTLPSAIYINYCSAVYNLFNLGRHLVRAQHYRNLRMSAFTEWSRAVARF